MTGDETFPAFTAAHRAATLLHKLDEGQATRKAKAAKDDMTHAPTCQRLVIVVTKGYTVTVNRCDECGAITTTRHGTNPPPKVEVTGGGGRKRHEG